MAGNEEKTFGDFYKPNADDPKFAQGVRKVVGNVVGVAGKALDTAGEFARDVTEKAGGFLKERLPYDTALDTSRHQIPTDVPEDFEPMIAFLTALPPTGFLTAGQRPNEEQILGALEAAKQLLEQRASSGGPQNTRSQTELAIVEDMLQHRTGGQTEVDALPQDTGAATEQVAPDVPYVDPTTGRWVEPRPQDQVVDAAQGQVAAPVAGLVMSGTDEDIHASADAAHARTFARTNGDYDETISEVAENMFNQRPGPEWRGTVRCDSTAGARLLAGPSDNLRAYACHTDSNRIMLNSQRSGEFLVYAKGEAGTYRGQDAGAVTGNQWSVHSFTNQSSNYVVGRVADSSGRVRGTDYAEIRKKKALSGIASTWGWAENHATEDDNNHPRLMANSLENGMKATGTTERVGTISGEECIPGGESVDSASGKKQKKRFNDCGYTKFVDDDLVSQTVLAITVNTIEKQAIFSGEANDLIVGWKLAGKWPNREALFTGAQATLLAAYEDETHGLEISPAGDNAITVRIPFFQEDGTIDSDTYTVTWVGGNDVTWTKDND